MHQHPKHETASVDDTELEQIRIFATRLNALLDKNGYPPTPHGRCLKLVEDGLAHSISGARKWCQGLAIPGAANLTRLTRHFETTADYLLGLTPDEEDNQRGVQSLIEIPIFHFDMNGERVDGDTTENFRRAGSIYCEPGEGDKTARSQICLLQCWDTLRTPIVSKGDLLYLDLGFTRLIDNQVYLISTPTTVTLRKVRALLDSRIEFYARYDDRQETDALRFGEITFNESNSINSPAPTAGVKIIAQVIGRVESYGSKLPGLA